MTPRPIAGPQIAIGVDADTYRFVDLKRVGIYAGYVEFYISISPNKILNVTTNGITPTCGSPVVGSSSVLVDNREISELAQGGMAKVMKVNKGRSEKLASAIKAIFCDSGAASDISSHTYELGPGHMVQVTMTLSGPIVASDLNDQAKNDLLKALADIIGLDVELMEVVSVRDPRRRLLTVQLTLGIVAKSAAQGEEIKAAIANTDIGALMAVVGWSNIEVTYLETIVKAPQSERSTPMPSTPASKVPIIVAAVVGSTLFLGITVAVLYFVLSRRRAAQLLSEKRAVADSIEGKISDLQPPDIETREETEIGTETETEAAVADFNRDIQLMENFGPEVMRLVKGRRNMNVVPVPMEASADFVHPDLFQPAMDKEDIEMRISGTPRARSNTNAPVADVGIDLSSFNLMLPWQQQVLQQSDVETDEPAGAEIDETVQTSPVSAKFHKSLQTVNLWKAQQRLKVETGPVGSRTATPMHASALSQHDDSVHHNSGRSDVLYEALGAPGLQKNDDEEQTVGGPPPSNLLTTIFSTLGGQPASDNKPTV
jgi:hypothetical protein